NPEHAELYDNAKLISQQLSMIMRTQLVKRLESSFEAFTKSLYRFYISNQRMIDMFKNDKVFIAPDIDVNKFLDEGREDELEQRIEALSVESPNNKVFKASDFSEQMLKGLEKD